MTDQLVRFLALGGVSNIVYAGLFCAFAAEGVLVANVAGVIGSTALANELHRRFTFHASDRVGWFHAQWEAGGVALAGLALSSAVLGYVDHRAENVDPVANVLIYVAVTGTVGLLRFTMLRRWVYSTRRRTESMLHSKSSVTRA